MKTSYIEKLKDPRWQAKRLQVFQRDGFKCRDCGNSEQTLHVHHCFYSKGGPWETPDEFLITLCADCHAARHPIEDRAKHALAAFFARLGNSADDFELSYFVEMMERVATSGKSPIVIEEPRFADLVQEAGR